MSHTVTHPSDSVSEAASETPLDLGIELLQTLTRAMASAFAAQNTAWTIQSDLATDLAVVERMQQALHGRKVQSLNAWIDGVIDEGQFWLGELLFDAANAMLTTLHQRLETFPQHRAGRTHAEYKEIQGQLLGRCSSDVTGKANDAAAT
jgi:hypothetical protein